MAESNALLKINEIQKSDSALWNSFVDSSPQGTFFHTTTWADIISSTFGRSYNIILCMRNEQPVGGMIFFPHKKLIWKMITPTAFFPYCAPIFYRPVDEKSQKTIQSKLNITASFENYLRNWKSIISFFNFLSRLSSNFIFLLRIYKSLSETEINDSSSCFFIFDLLLRFLYNF